MESLRSLWRNKVHLIEANSGAVLSGSPKPGKGEGNFVARAGWVLGVSYEKRIKMSHAERERTILGPAKGFWCAS